MNTVASDGAEHRTKRERLATELRRLRDQAGISGRDLAHRVGISQSKVSRIESGTVIPSLPEVTAWGEAVVAAVVGKAGRGVLRRPGPGLSAALPSVGAVR